MKNLQFFPPLSLSEIVIQCNIECLPFANARNWNSMTSYFVSIDRSANNEIRTKLDHVGVHVYFDSTAFATYDDDDDGGNTNGIEFSIWPCFYITFLKWDFFFHFNVRSGYRSAYQFCVCFFAIFLRPYLHVSHSLSPFYSLFILTLNSAFVVLVLLLPYFFFSSSSCVYSHFYTLTLQ